MFTGLVEGTATVASLTPRGQGARLALDLGTLGADLAGGSSIAVAGACLSVADREGPVCLFELSPETLAKTRLGSVAPGDLLNLERALAAGAPLGGHWVTGHVDGVGRVTEVVPQGDCAEMGFQAPPEVTPYLVSKGSVAVEGVSLTVASLDGSGGFRVALIPETLTRTTLGRARPGDPVHMEGDLLGKYVLRYIARAAQDPEGFGLLLRQAGAGAAWEPPG